MQSNSTMPPLQTLPLPNVARNPVDQSLASASPESLTVDPEAMANAPKIFGVKRVAGTPSSFPSRPSDPEPANSDMSNNIDAFMGHSSFVPLSVPHSAFLSAYQGAMSVPLAADYLTQMATGKPHVDDLMTRYNAVQKELDTAPEMGLGQEGLNFVANMAGNPMTYLWPLAAKGVGVGINVASKILPDSVAAFAKAPLTEILGENSFTPKITEAGIKKVMPIGKAAALLTESKVASEITAIPQSVVDNYDQDTNSLRWGGFMKAEATAGAIGVAIPATPFLAGTLFKKLDLEYSSPGDASPAVLNEFEKARDTMRISQEEYSWLRDYASDPKNGEQLSSQASLMLDKESFPVDHSSGHVNMSLLKKEDVDGVNNALIEQSGIDPSNTTLSDYIIHNRMDDVRQNNENYLPGLRGYIGSIDNKLGGRAEQLSKADELLESSTSNKFRDNPISQEKLYQILKAMKGDTSRTRYVIPEEVETRLKNENIIKDQTKRIKNLSDKLESGKVRGSKNQRIIAQKIEAAKAKIQTAQDTKPKMQTLKEELESLRGRLLGNGLPENFKVSRDYHRLADLAEIVPRAKALLARINLEHEYNMQGAYRDVVSSISGVIRSSLPKMAHPEDVKGYLRDRLQEAAPELQETKAEVENKVKGQTKGKSPESGLEPGGLEEKTTETPEQKQSVLKQQEEEVSQSRDSGAENLSDEFDKVNAKAQEFQKQQTVFKNLISCLSGAL